MSHLVALGPGSIDGRCWRLARAAPLGVPREILFAVPALEALAAAARDDDDAANFG